MGKRRIGFGKKNFMPFFQIAGGSRANSVLRITTTCFPILKHPNKQPSVANAVEIPDCKCWEGLDTNTCAAKLLPSRNRKEDGKP